MLPTAHSAGPRYSRMSRRLGSAMALKMSEVVAARGIAADHIPITEYVKYRHAKPDQSIRAQVWMQHRGELFVCKTLRHENSRIEVVRKTSDRSPRIRVMTTAQRIDAACIGSVVISRATEVRHRSRPGPGGRRGIPCSISA
jgi:hypothetical protein